MRRKDLVLAAMSPARDDPFSPVQVQKLFFLLDKQIPEFIDGPHFRFAPYDYGPFDKDVYLVLETLCKERLVEISISPSNHSREYHLTDRGHEIGRKNLRNLPKNVQDHITKVVFWIRPLSFAELVSAIYNAYPEMKENSVFRSQK